VSAKRDQAAKAGDEFASEATKAAGGAKAYAAMTEWASKGGMTKAEVEDFNAVIDSKNAGAMRLAVKAMKARYEQANGRLPRVNPGVGSGQQKSMREAGEVRQEADAGGDVFESLEQVRAAQRDPRYQKDPAYRQGVERKLVRSNLFGKARRG
jgi:hypothetical protein